MVRAHAQKTCIIIGQIPSDTAVAGFFCFSPWAWSPITPLEFDVPVDGPK